MRFKKKFDFYSRMCDVRRKDGEIVTKNTTGIVISGVETI